MRKFRVELIGEIEVPDNWNPLQDGYIVNGDKHYYDKLINLDTRNLYAPRLNLVKLSGLKSTLQETIDEIANFQTIRAELIEIKPPILNEDQLLDLEEDDDGEPLGL
jgi:hypothetical protein